MTVNLPYDVWSQIFLYVVQSSVFSLFDLRSVNREWLNTADVTPGLWTTLVLNRQIHFSDLGYVFLFLENSRGLPLDVSIDCACDHLPISMAPIEALTSVVHKMRSLIITGKNFLDSSLLVKMIGMEQPAPLLESLAIRIKTHWSYYFPPQQFSTKACFSPSPKLKTLELPLARTNLEKFPHLSIVTTLILNVHKASELPGALIYLKNSPKVRHFHYRCTDDHDRELFIYRPRFTHPLQGPHLSNSLSSVHLTMRGGGLDILRNLNAPLLNTVSIDGWRHKTLTGRNLQPGALISTLKLTSQRCALIRRLELYHIRIEHPVKHYRRLLSGKLFPALEELVIECSNIRDDALIRPCDRSSSSNLTLLEIRKCENVTAEAVRCFMEARGGKVGVLFSNNK